jgi:FkbM family methyltransferase
MGAFMNIIEFLGANLRPDDIVFEIGANQGHCIDIEADVVERVVAFEPNPQLAGHLRARFAGRRNVEIRDEAVSSEIGTATFYIDERPDAGAVGSSLLDMSRVIETSTITVNTTTIDHMVETLGIVPTFIKIDTEGAEPMVLAGARKTIETHRPRLVFELWETHWPRYQEAVAWLSPLYKLTLIQDGAEAISTYASGRHVGVADIYAKPLASSAVMRS